MVACELGRMYNKEAIIEKLLNAKSEGTSSDRDRVAEHIRNLKDVKELQLEPNPAFKGTYLSFLQIMKSDELSKCQFTKFWNSQR